MLWGVLLALLTTTIVLLVRPPLFQSTATVFVRTPGDVSTVVDGGDSYAQGRARSYASLVGNASVASTVIADLGLDLQPEELARRVHGVHRPGTALFDISVSAPAPAEAQRIAAVLIDEYSTTIRQLEAVPGSVVPRAELIVVDPPQSATRVVAWGAPVPAVLFGAALAGLVLGALGAVLRSIFDPARLRARAGSTANADGDQS